jgi:hypothetical protein
MIQAYQAIFPGLFRSQGGDARLPARAHVRVPLDQFTVQTQMLLQYHMEDPVVFYNKEDQWSVPVQTSFGRHQPLRPYYIVARLPGEPREEFLLIQPFTPASRHNLVGWMAARSDGRRTTASWSSSVSPPAATWTGPARWRRASTTTPSSPSSSRSGGRWAPRSCAASSWSSRWATRSSTPSPCSSARDAGVPRAPAHHPGRRHHRGHAPDHATPIRLEQAAAGGRAARRGWTSR